VYSNPFIEPGDYAIFFGTTLTTQNNKPELAGYAAREHLLGIQFCPYLKTKKIKTFTIYGQWIAYWHLARNTLYKKLEAILPAHVFTYLAALFLGNKNRDDFLAMRAKFTNWGLTHYLARSGLHISLLISLWIGALRCMPISLPIKGILLFSILCLYDHLSWANISFNRALWLWFFYLGSWLTDRIATPIFGFAHLTLLILLTNPWYAGCLDFQLSFFLTAVLMIYSYFRKQQFMLSSCVKKNK
jgi:predicted membrane metal-binding protein